MKEKDKKIHCLLVNVLEEIREYLEELPFVQESHSPQTVVKIIFKQLVKRLIHFRVDFFAIKVHEIADWEFEVTVNNVVKSTLLLNQKKDPDES